MILDELRHIRSRMDSVLGPDSDAAAPPASSAPQRPPTPAAPLREPEEVKIVNPQPVDNRKPEPPAPPTPKPAKKPQPKSEPKPKPKPKSKPKPQPQAKQQDAESFKLETPASPKDAVRLFSDQKKRIENMMAVAQFTRAEKLAQALLAVMPTSDDAENLLETVRRESSAFRTEQQARLFSEFQKWTESRQWIKAQTVGQKLLEKYPASEEGQAVAASMHTVEKNAHFEEARILRDRVRDLIKRKRYNDAIEIAEDLMRRFPNTQVAKQLRAMLPDLKKRSAQFG